VSAKSRGIEVLPSGGRIKQEDGPERAKGQQNGRVGWPAGDMRKSCMNRSVGRVTVDRAQSDSSTRRCLAKARERG